MTPTKIFFYKLLHVLPLVEHPQLDADVRALVELLDKGVDDLLRWAKKSNTEPDDPTRDAPNVERELPHLTQARREIELPKCKKSRTETDEPHRPTP